MRYHVDLSRAENQVISVEMTLDGVRTESVDVRLPVWRPGLYAILDQAGTIRSLKALTPDDQPLDAVKVDKSTWRITTQVQSSIRVAYDVWAASLDNRTRHADDTHAFMSPSAVFLYADDWRSLPIEITLDATSHTTSENTCDWSLATGLASSTRDDGILDIKAPDYDTLADSPIEAGLQNVHRFDVDGVPHELVMWEGRAASSISNLDLYKSTPDAIAAIVHTQKAIFGSLPYDRYVFILHCYPGARGGTEHLNSTVIQAPPEAFRDESRHRRFLSLVSHEMFHTWNVKRFRPAGLVPYDYQKENYTELLWLAEGTTSYYEDLVLVRAGLMKPDDFLKALGESIDALRKRPGNNVQSLRDSSFDAWIKYNRHTPDAVNSTVSFYDKGALASLILDMSIRARTNHAHSLDTLMRRLFERFPSPNKGYTTGDVRTILGELAGDFDDFFRTAIDGTGDLDFEAALAVCGLEIQRVAEPALADVGLTVTDQNGLAVINEVLDPGPGATAGLNPGDVLLSINDIRVRPGDLDAAIKNIAPGTHVTLTYFRRDELRHTVLLVGTKPAKPLLLQRVENPSDSAKAAYASWLGQPWPGDNSSDAKP